jgi:hypothetical protein
MPEAQAVAQEMPESSESNGDDKSREKSTIEFPYSSLNDGIEIAKAVHELHGSSATIEQIAAHISSTPTSGTFRTKMATSKVFRLVTVSQGVATLAPIGRRICDPQQEKAARADAFLAVPLYSRIYEDFKTTVLPPPAGLESAIVSMGVSQKQRERARQVFHRSAQEAGFFQFGSDRLIMPAIKASTVAPASPAQPETPSKKKTKDEDEDEDQLHPFIKGLLKKLPPPDTEWPNEKRAKWLQAAVNIFDLMYTEAEDDSRRTITIGFHKDSAKQ